MAGYFVYLLISEKDGDYYIGQTGDICQRLKAHNDGEVISTKHRRPLRLVGYKEFSSRNEARHFEHEIKHHSDKKRRFISELHRPSFRA
ncbi:MAG: GIY-YIG nuclease family protein [Thermodesulfobacteriota bacterium]